MLLKIFVTFCLKISVQKPTQKECCAFQWKTFFLIFFIFLNFLYRDDTREMRFAAPACDIDIEKYIINLWSGSIVKMFVAPR